MRHALLLSLFLFGCGAGATPGSGPDVLAQEREAQPAQAVAIGRGHAQPVADLEVSVRPEVSRVALTAEVARRIRGVETIASGGCDVAALLGRMRVLASSMQTAADPWNDYAMVVTIERRVVADCE